MSFDTNEIKWDGRDYAYVPPQELSIDPSLKLHKDCAEEVDPITFEVIRHSLWNINVEHGNTIMRISGSPICAYGHDFNPCILDEEGGFVFFGPFLQYLSSVAGSAVKWTLENRSDNPGIEDGDIFLTNDPWIGATHQSDVTLLAPVFYEGELFCWVTNTLHQWDLGGTAPGGFNPVAPDIFSESGCIPPIKIVEQGVLRKDLEEEYLRRSRMPKLVALDLRAEMAGCNVSRSRILNLIDRYGAETIKAVMKKLQDDSEKAFVKRLESIPDGTWSESTWAETSEPGDRNLYKVTLSVTKKGDRLIFSNEGTAPQGGTLNCTLVGWKGAIGSMINAQMLHDQMFVVEGAYRHLDFIGSPGTMTCATYPAAVSAGTALSLLQTITLSALVISKMLSSSTDEALRTEVQSSFGSATYPIIALSGLDQRGEPFASFLLDPSGAALAGLSWRDGVDTGGFPWDLQSTMPNVEDNEWFYSILYLWRKELPGSGGAGKYRGGNCAELAIIPHDTEDLSLFVAAGHLAVPPPGLAGGLSPATTRYTLLRNSDVKSFAKSSGMLPRSMENISAQKEHLAAKAFDIRIGKDDVLVVSWSAAGGYGDPLERDPDVVEGDYTQGVITADVALNQYGVVVNDRGEVDVAGTEKHRRAVREARVGEAGMKSQRKTQSPGNFSLSDGLQVSTEADVPVISCRKCQEYICDASENYKLHSALQKQHVSEINPYILDPRTYVDDEMIVNNYCCRSCGLLFSSDIQRQDTEPDWDIKLRV